MRPNKLTKISHDGSYTPFFGYTVISFLEDSDKLSDLLNYINQSRFIKKYYTALPLNSMHMTILNLCVFDRDECIKKLNDDEFQSKLYVLQDMVDAIVSNERTNVALPRINLSNLKFQAGNTLTIPVDIVDEKRLQEVQQFRDEGMKYMNIDDSRLKFHITLAYNFKHIRASDLSGLYTEFIELSNKIHNLGTITLKEPQICFFPDMTKYITLKHHVQYMNREILALEQKDDFLSDS